MATESKVQKGAEDKKVSQAHKKRKKKTPCFNMVDKSYV